MSNSAGDCVPALKPAGLAAAAALFGIPALLGCLMIWVTIPWLDGLGVPLWVNVPAQFMALIGGMGTAAVLGWRRAGVRTGRGLAKALRLSPMKSTHWLWAVPVVLIGAGAYNALEPVSWSVIGDTRLPDWLPRFITRTHLLDLELPGHPGPVFLYLAIYLVNVVGEELWWRGYVLPRQELAHGRRAWAVHALMWDAFHVFFFWDMLPLLPMALLLSFVSQRTQSTWPALIAHFALNGQVFLRLVPAAMGS
jgi:membrane protease YdiL (CAAX protease family)